MDIEKLLREVYNLSKEINNFSEAYKAEYEDYHKNDIDDCSLDYYLRDMIRSIAVFSLKFQTTLEKFKEEDEKQ